MTLIQQFGFVTPIDCKERNVKPSHRCPFSDKLSLFRATITRTTLFCFATDVPLSFLKASEVRWNLTRGIWAFVFAFNCCPRGGSLCCRCCSGAGGAEGAGPWLPVTACRTGAAQSLREFARSQQRFCFKSVFLTPMPGSSKSCRPSTRWIGAYISELQANSGHTQK